MHTYIHNIRTHVGADSCCRQYFGNLCLDYARWPRRSANLIVIFAYCGGWYLFIYLLVWSGRV